LIFRVVFGLCFVS